MEITTLCRQVVGVDSFNIDGLVSENTEISITCPSCFHQFNHSLQFAQGDPRNIALIGYWNGWQPFLHLQNMDVVSKHIDCISLLSILGTIELHIATMSKVDRSRTEEVYVCGFVSSCLLPNKMPWSLDPFISPLI